VKNLQKKNKNVSELESTPPSTIWLRDLDAIENALDEREVELKATTSEKLRAKKKIKPRKKKTLRNCDESDKTFEESENSSVEIMPIKKSKSRSVAKKKRYENSSKDTLIGRDIKCSVPPNKGSFESVTKASDDKEVKASKEYARQKSSCNSSKKKEADLDNIDDVDDKVEEATTFKKKPASHTKKADSNLDNDKDSLDGKEIKATEEQEKKSLKIKKQVDKSYSNVEEPNEIIKFTSQRREVDDNLDTDEDVLGDKEMKTTKKQEKASHKNKKELTKE